MTTKSDGVDLEQQYFQQEDARKIQALKDAKANAEAASSREQLRELHHQRCGKCGGQMTPQLFKGVEIDICGGCGAVLLDPGELETLVGPDESGALDTLAEFFKFSRSR